MSDTPICDREAFTCTEQVEWEGVPIETARQLERMCNELAGAIGTSNLEKETTALARWQAMKDGK